MSKSTEECFVLCQFAFAASVGLLAGSWLAFSAAFFGCLVLEGLVIKLNSRDK